MIFLTPELPLLLAFFFFEAFFDEGLLTGDRLQNDFFAAFLDVPAHQQLVQDVVRLWLVWITFLVEVED